MPFHAPGIVIELGSYCCKAGFACDNHPVSIFRSVVGRPKNLQGCYGKFPYDVYIGEEAISHVDYDLYSPIVAGKIVHWDNMERIWHHIFYRELKVAPEERAVIVTTDPRTTILEKLKFCEIFFETLNVPALCVQAQSVMSLYGSGTTTGIAVDLGYDITEVNPVYEGGLISYARMETNFSGCTITKFMLDSFKRKGENLGQNAESVVEDIIRHQLFVDPHGTEVCRSVKYKLPTGKVIDIGKEIHTATEMIFDPVLTTGGSTEYAPLPETVLTSAGKCDASLHDELFNAVVVTGGLSAVPGLRQRLAYELTQGTKYTVNIPDTQEPYTVAWLGAAIFAGMEDSKKLWIHKHQFEEYGFKIVKNKFI